MRLTDGTAVWSSVAVTTKKTPSHMQRAGLQGVVERVRHMVHIPLHPALHRVFNLPGVMFHPETIALDVNMQRAMEEKQSKWGRGDDRCMHSMSTPSMDRKHSGFALCLVT